MNINKSSLTARIKRGIEHWNRSGVIIIMGCTLSPGRWWGLLLPSCLLVLQLCCMGRLTSAQSCKFTNIHLVNEHGQEQILTFQEPDDLCGAAPSPACGCQGPPTGSNNVQTCQHDEPSVYHHQRHVGARGGGPVPSPKQRSPAFNGADKEPHRQLVYSTGPDGLPYPAHKIPQIPFNFGARHLELAPIVSVFTAEAIADFCADEADETEMKMCDELKKLTGCPTENRDAVENYASHVVERNLLPVPSGDTHVDTQIAYGLVLLATGLTDEAIEYFTQLIKEYPNLASAYHGRGTSLARKGIVVQLTTQAIEDFTKAIELEPGNAEHYLRRAELCISMARHDDAKSSIESVLSLDPHNQRALFLKATLIFAIGNLKSAEKLYRETLESSAGLPVHHTYYNLALLLYYRGMLRNSIEVFKDIVKDQPNNVDAHASLAHVYGQLGDEVNARKFFNKTMHLDNQHLLGLKVQGNFHFNTGDLKHAVEDFQTCLTVQPDAYFCQYMEAVSLTTSGQFYSGLKAFTKVLVNKQRPMKMSPEFIKAHYLREYARYLHSNLDENLLDVDFDNDLPTEFKDKWVRVEKFYFKTPYKEQPGLSPSISDVNPSTTLDQYPPDIQELLCYARSLGHMADYATDGFVSNQRSAIATGLAAVHIAQKMKDVWNDVGASKTGPGISWKELFDIAVRYQRLVNPEEPVFWLDGMPASDQEQGYTHNLYILRGHTINVRLMNYFDLVYKLVKTMISVHCGEGEMYPEIIMHELFTIETYEEMIDVFKKDLFRGQGFVMATQVPSMKEPKTPKYEGVYLSIASDKHGKVSLSINLPYNREKANAIHKELDFVFYELYHEVRKLEGKSSEDPDHIVNLILSLIYYFLNLSPLSHSTGAVAWSVALGLVMSVGREVTTRLSTGKLLEIEAALAGGPDTFSMVSKKWLNIKRMKKNVVPVFPSVSENFRTVRDVLEALNLQTPSCSQILLHSSII